MHRLPVRIFAVFFTKEVAALLRVLEVPFGLARAAPVEVLLARLDVAAYRGTDLLVCAAFSYLCVRVLCGLKLLVWGSGLQVLGLAGLEVAVYRAADMLVSSSVRPHTRVA
jgi:hypothetical protein